MTTVTIKREFVPLPEQEAADYLAAIAFILKKYLPDCIDSPLTPDEIPDKLEVNATLPQEGEA